MDIVSVPDTIAADRLPEVTTSVSVIVTAYNEEQYLRNTILSIMEAIVALDSVDVEIVIVNDGSADDTATVANALEADFPLVRCIHHDRNRGFGVAFQTGLDAANHDYVTFLPGDNLISTATIRELLKHVGQAEVVFAFPLNVECRSRLRLLISSIYSFVYRQTFNLHLRAIHTTPVYPVRLLRETPLHSTGYGRAAEITVKLLRQGCTYMELPCYLNLTENHSSALQFKNLIEVVRSYVRLIIEVYGRDRNRYSRSAVRVTPKELRN
jgi:glycosyltransferase involved in cell wall biosynthesis